MTISKKNSPNQSKFFKNIPEGLLQDTLPTMRSVIVLLNEQEEQEERNNEDNSITIPSL
ncbi:hypothetical protein [Legionella cardiaca]|uniref:Uncharacterized protein n=1 Tax=Legionella cardiaca TaxID=1071983 RepID=A0ABY8AUT5_9GAMM|nr:hypothetical protein [Legionella cardiaca]WED44433.1 hypothetical protein PXX05_06520 [Legionella cardiaca]